ncbi:hypothetical protein FRC03_006113 [Tulasnella sp. 419]|nr:hypothetical protein FRC03_006113 [Tulasnella sp. 419]
MKEHQIANDTETQKEAVERKKAHKGIRKAKRGNPNVWGSTRRAIGSLTDDYSHDVQTVNPALSLILAPFSLVIACPWIGLLDECLGHKLNRVNEEKD